MDIGFRESRELADGITVILSNTIFFLAAVGLFVTILRLRT